MKKILYIMVAVLAFAGCTGEKEEADTPAPPVETETLSDQIVGEWHSTSLAVQADIYLSLAGDKTFELYQKIGEGAYRLYRGTWKLEDTVLSGKYNDGESWAASYEVSINGNSLSLTSKNDAAEKSSFTKTDIPEEVKDGCEIVVKSATAAL